MPKRKTNNGQSESTEDAKLKAICAESRRKFTAAELQKYTVIEKGIPLKKVIGEMEEIHRTTSQKKKAPGKRKPMDKRKTNNGQIKSAEDAKLNAVNAEGRKEYTAAELKAIYAEGRRKFSAADLQKYTVIEEGVPAEQVLQDLIKAQRKFDKRKRV